MRVFWAFSAFILVAGCVGTPMQRECYAPSDCALRDHTACLGDWGCQGGNCTWTCANTTVWEKPRRESNVSASGDGLLSYPLPLKPEDIANYADVKSRVNIAPGEERLLLSGFAVIDDPFNPGEDDMTGMYEDLKGAEVPVFITTDSLLHMYHIQFDESLRRAEEGRFYDLMWNVSVRLLEANMRGYNASYGASREAYRRNVGYFGVALELFKPSHGQYCLQKDLECMMDEGKFRDGEEIRYNFTVPDYVRDDVESELKLIRAHEGFSKSPMFVYEEDYSQYLPRGHYTRSEKLKNYFRAMMWYGRAGFLLKGGKILSKEEAMMQTTQASVISKQLEQDNTAREMWDTVYNATAFYVGFSDDLLPSDYNRALYKVFSGGYTPNQMTGSRYDLFRAQMAAIHRPLIYGGTGNCVIMPPFTSEQSDECLGDSMGLRLMGQRFIPDSYMFQNLVFPKVEGRFFPKGLDVMALLGSVRAYELLEESGDANMKGYGIQYRGLQEEFGNITEDGWRRNLYWSWLNSLKPLLTEKGAVYPTFMRTREWEGKELTTCLASWTELRHDTILYAKQSYTMKAGSAGPGPAPKPVVGYVEPQPEFYGRLIELTNRTMKGLDGMGALDNAQRYRLNDLMIILTRLKDISENELEGREIGRADYEFIRDFGANINRVVADVDEKAKKTTIVADVHTDTNSNRALEEGVGHVRMMLVAYKTPDGNVYVGAGPAFSYYEFTQPMAERLTDEEWARMLDDSPPKRPGWAQ